MRSTSPSRREVLVAAGAAFHVLRLDCEIADVLRRQGHPDQAKPLLNTTLAAIDPADDLMAVSDIHRRLGLILATDGDAATAEEHYRAALALLEQADAALELVVTCRLLGDLLTRRHHPRGIRSRQDIEKRTRDAVSMATLNG